MSLFQQWEDLMNSQTDATFRDFWEKYSATETKIYSAILADPSKQPSGTFDELVAHYDVDPVIFMGFLDGINSSLQQELAIETFDETSPITLDIDLEKLYFNMHAAGADYLYHLPEWEPLLSAERRLEIEKEYKRSKTVVKEKEPGRNDPCPCGSGKKYKKCCGQ